MAGVTQENITKYLRGVRAFGVDEYELFSTNDLYDGKDMKAVVTHIHALGRFVQDKCPDYDGPTLGHRVVKKNVRTFTKEQLAAAAAAPSLLNLGSSDLAKKAAMDVLSGKGAFAEDAPTSGAGVEGGEAAEATPAGRTESTAKKEEPTAKKEASLPAGWEALTADDGRTYYYHAASQVTQWDPPAAGAAASLPAGWEALTTDDGRTYYYHAASEVTQWDPPTGGAVASLPAGWEALTADDGRTYYYHAASQVTQWDPPTGGAVASLPAGWEALTADDGRTYYYHAASQVTQWDPPTA
jgi:hypothetical protein